MLRLLLTCVAVCTLTACGGEGAGDPIRVHIPVGASFSQVTDSLASKDIVEAAPLFKLYARMRSATASVQPGTYAFRRGTSWARILDDLRNGRVLTARLVIPEAWDLRGIAPRIAAATGLDEDSVMYLLTDTAIARRLDVPGPTLEGYLYPATYSFPVGAPLDTLLGQMVSTYRRVWTPERRARADSMGLSEREIVTLASIIEKEARKRDEMPTISAVYHNRLKRGQRLEADPTVQYALGEHQQRLLYAHIDSVAGNPYNTYRHAGLPPGPIGSPSQMGIDAALYPADVNYLFFVARPDGSHVFTRTFAEHTRARAMVRRLEREQAARSSQGPGGDAPAPPRPRP
ncbi:MAG TPA: endolytic transglycosylase MltG [Longimicrobiales bacterium]